MKTWLKDNGTVIGALAGVALALVAVLQLTVVGPMNRGFDNVNQRFDDLRAEMNARFDAVDQRFDQQDRRLDFLANEVSELRKLTVNITERVSRNEGQIDLITERFRLSPAPSP